MSFHDFLPSITAIFIIRKKRGMDLLTYGPKDGRTDGHDLLKRCVVASKKQFSILRTKGCLSARLSDCLYVCPKLFLNKDYLRFLVENFRVTGITKLRSTVTDEHFLHPIYPRVCPSVRSALRKQIWNHWDRFIRVYGGSNHQPLQK